MDHLWLYTGSGIKGFYALEGILHISVSRSKTFKDRTRSVVRNGNDM